MLIKVLLKILIKIWGINLRVHLYVPFVIERVTLRTLVSSGMHNKSKLRDRGKQTLRRLQQSVKFSNHLVPLELEIYQVGAIILIMLLIKVLLYMTLIVMCKIVTIPRMFVTLFFPISKRQELNNCLVNLKCLHK